MEHELLVVQDVIQYVDDDEVVVRVAVVDELEVNDILISDFEVTSDETDQDDQVTDTKPDNDEVLLVQVEAQQELESDTL